jgi:urease accessory protein
MSVATLRYERPAAAPDTARAAPLERGHGAAELGFVRRGDGTALAHLFQRTPCRVLFPRPDAGDPLTAVLLTTSGGLAGGDVLDIDIDVAAGAGALVTSQAAEKVYRSLGPDCRVAARLAVADGAALEFLPQETILFEGARLRRRTVVEVAATGRFLACDMLVFGRTARGEAYTRGRLHDVWEVRRDGRLAWFDAVRLDGDIAATLASPMAFGDAVALATALYLGEDAAGLLPRARAMADDGPSRAGATLVNGVLLARFLGPRASHVRAHLGRYLSGLRHAALGRPAQLPRVWGS